MSLTDEIFKGTAMYHKQFNKMCEPIMRYFGVNSAYYVNINNNGELINLHTSREWMERCMEQHYYRNDQGMVCPENIASGFAISNQHIIPTDNNPMLQDGTNVFDMYHSCYLVEKDKDSYQLFGFDAPKANTKFLHRVINERRVFKTLLKNLQANLNSQNKQLEACKADFARIKGELYYSQQGIISIEHEEQAKKIAILRDLGILNYDLHNLSLSTQEKRCLRLYVENNTVKQAAKYLNLSPETVKSYLSNVRNKLNCSCKRELIQIAGILEGLGML